MPPGAADPAVTQSNIDTTICAKGWSKHVRPPASYTGKLKRDQIAGRADPRLYEEDHLIPLELGGASRDPRNLWPQLWDGPDGAHAKDRLERRLHNLVCSHAVSLEEAQKAIATDWRAAYRKYMGE
jgi:hypothetical protein